MVGQGQRRAGQGSAGQRRARDCKGQGCISLGPKAAMGSVVQDRAEATLQLLLQMVLFAMQQADASQA